MNYSLVKKSELIILSEYIALLVGLYLLPVPRVGIVLVHQGPAVEIKAAEIDDHVLASRRATRERERERAMERIAGGSDSTARSPPPVHPLVAPLEYLLGKWRGEGEGGYPTINSFSYGEELVFSHSGKPVISYSQKTWKLASGEPMHAESGYWRPRPDGSIDVVIAQSTGLVEVQVLSIPFTPELCR